MATNQPTWVYVTNLGDATPLEYGGLFLYRDSTGVYPAELEKLDEPADEVDVDDDAARWTVHRVCLDQCKLQRDGDTLYLIPASIDPETAPHPIPRYVEWFADSLASVADTMGTTKEALEQALCSADDAARADAYRCIYDYHGWDNGDSEPLTLTRAEVEARYKDGEL